VYNALAEVGGDQKTLVGKRHNTQLTHVTVAVMHISSFSRHFKIDMYNFTPVGGKRITLHVLLLVSTS
jgi:hypothetical protein